ncbi:MAG: fumarylacetoacetate hydrolase family protein, partial [Alphaproteobacteria bacterium]|nr:fumarylacetoacetate hydrolase family protein [Alphaproteobacteria bacterium]
MKLATIDHGGRSAAAIILPDGSAVPLERVAAALKGDLPVETSTAFATGDLQRVIALGPMTADTTKAIAAAVEAGHLAGVTMQGSAVQLLAPLPHLAKNVFCVGRNYLEHIAEGERAQNLKIGVTEHPVFFTKPPTSVVGPGADVPIFPKVSVNIDYEVELAVVIGKAGRNIAPEQAMEHI